MNNPLSGSKAVRGKEIWGGMMDEMEVHLDTYRVSANDVMKRATEFEIEMKNDKLMRAMHHCAYDLADIHTIMRMNSEN